jgi:hypothetical protein
MALKIKLTAEEHGKLTTELQAAYKQVGDAFVLDAEGIDDITDLTGALDRIKADNKRLRDEAASLRTQAEKVKDVDPEKYKQLMAEAEQRDKDIKEKKGEYDAIVKQMNDQHAKDLAKKDQEIASMRAALEEHLIEATAIAAIAENKGEPMLLLPIIRRRTRVVKGDDGKFAVQVLDESGNPKVDGAGKAITIAALVAEMKGDKIFGRAFEANGQSGGGHPPAARPGARPVGDGTEGPKTSFDKIKSGIEKVMQGGGTA